jgi:TusA-related sulfurtransferase
MADATLDAGVENCGRLIGLVMEAMTQLTPGQTLAVRAYDPSSHIDLAAWCRMTGHELRSVTPDANHLELVIQKATEVQEVSHGTRAGQQHTRQG